MKKKLVFFALLLLATQLVFSQNTLNKPDALNAYRRGDYQGAMNICLAELADNPGNIESHVVICWSLIALGRYEEARTYGLQGLTLSRYDNRLIEIMGESNYYLGRNNDALRYFQEYINMAPDGTRIGNVYYYMGEVYIRLGRFRHADIALSTAVYYLPGNANWWSRLAYARENAGDYSQAVSAYEQALSLDASLTDASRGLARVRQAMSR
ncbi:MAG: tetratricopeptide repeat protein [Spirochaetaceae bacterium]|jgi:tetratricopeptide (TPR) repeat protein|nr:tetratricopeptide repeat protein [Spirochaetaceae bacterium]